VIPCPGRRNAGPRAIDLRTTGLRAVDVRTTGPRAVDVRTTGLRAVDVRTADCRTRLAPILGAILGPARPRLPGWPRLHRLARPPPRRDRAALDLDLSGQRCVTGGFRRDSYLGAAPGTARHPGGRARHRRTRTGASGRGRLARDCRQPRAFPIDQSPRVAEVGQQFLYTRQISSARCPGPPLDGLAHPRQELTPLCRTQPTARRNRDTVEKVADELLGRGVHAQIIPLRRRLVEPHARNNPQDGGRRPESWHRPACPLARQRPSDARIRGQPLPRE